MRIFTLNEFAQSENLTRHHLRRIRRQGDGPATITAGHREFVTEQARDEWRERMARQRASDTEGTGPVWTEERRQVQRERRLAFLQRTRERAAGVIAA
jgi:hypothetical protein